MKDQEKVEPGFIGLDDSQPDYVDPLGLQGIYKPGRETDRAKATREDKRQDRTPRAKPQ